MKKLFFTVAAFCNIALTAQVPDKPLLKVFDAAYRQMPRKNMLLSPWGIQECFGMAYGGAGKISAAELEQTLGIDRSLANELKQAKENFKNKKINFNSFNAIFFDCRYSLQKSFIDYAENQYSGKLYKVDFARKKETVEQLNAIVKRESSGMFDNIFTEKTLSGDPAVMLMNILYFKGRWAKSFEKELTMPEKFYAPGSSKFESIHHSRVDMMNDERFVPYYNDGTLHGIILEYKGYQSRDMKMLVLTTLKQDTPLSTVTRSLAERGVTHFVEHSSEKNKTVIKLPRLKLSGELDLKELFSFLGMKTLFDPRLGDLPGMVEKRNLFIEQAKQFVKLDLDENGSEVAAVTYAIAAVTCAPPMQVTKNHFYADHPFVLVLFDSQSQAVLLTAAVVSP